MKQIIDLAVSSIIRPPRCSYSLDNMPSSVPVPNQPPVPRQSVTFTNSRGHSLVGSFYSTSPSRYCVIYLHGNSSCQSEGIFLVPIFCPFQVSVFCFDFSGCGISEGDYISLGWFERDDVVSAVSYLRETFGIETFALWGRSMGAATTFYAISDNNPSIVCAVVDSPFSSLPLLLKELSGQFHIPGCLTPPVVWYLSKKIMGLAHFDIREVAPISVCRNAKTPLFVIHGEDDDFILPEHSRLLFEAYRGKPKEIRLIPGKHVDQRPYDVLTLALMFVGAWLDVPILLDDVEQKIRGAERAFARFERSVKLVGVPEGFDMEGEAE